MSFSIDPPPTDSRDNGLPDEPSGADAANSRDRAVTMPTALKWGIGILAVGFALGAIALLISFGLIASLDLAHNPAAAQLASILVVSGIVLVVEVVALVLVARGKSWARWVLAVLVGIGIITNFQSGGLPLGTIAQVVGIVLLFMPSSSAWFRQLGN